MSKKICLVLPTLKAGGMERVMSELANFLVRREHEVLVVLMYKAEHFFTLDKKVKIIEPRISKTSNLLYAFYLFPYIRKTIKNFRPDSILSFGERYNSYVLLSSLGLKAPVFISDRSSPKKALSNFNIVLSKLLYPNAKGIICQTKSSGAVLNSRLGKKTPSIKIIPNPLRKLEFGDSIPKEDLIIAVGRIVIEKRYDRLLDIYQKINNRDWKLLIVGDGPLKNELLTDIRNRNLESEVILQGNTKDVDHFYQKSKIYVLTSDSEGFPNTLCEAMGHGLPVISFDCIAGPGDIISNMENGILIDDGDVDAFAYELQKLLDDESLRTKLGENAKSINNELGTGNILREYENFILS